MAKHQGQITAIFTGSLVMALQAVGMTVCCFFFFAFVFIDSFLPLAERLPLLMK